jgi:hypothetical protein
MMVAKFATIILAKEIPLMPKSWARTRDLLERLRADKNGMASFEYILVAFCIIGAVGAALSPGAGGGVITTALTTGIGAVASAFTTAVAGA